MILNQQVFIQWLMNSDCNMLHQQKQQSIFQQYAHKMSNRLFIILLNEYLTMHYNQFAHLSASIQRNICLQPPPDLLSKSKHHQRASSSIQICTNKQSRSSKQCLKQKQSLESKIFESKLQKRNIKDIQQILKQKLKVSQYLQPLNQVCHSTSKKIQGNKKVCKDKRQKYKQVCQKGSSLASDGKKRLSLASSDYDGFFKPEENQTVFNGAKKRESQPTRGYSSSVQEPKQYYKTFHPIRSSSVIGLTKNNEQKKIRFILKTTKKSNKLNEKKMQKCQKHQQVSHTHSHSGSSNQIFYNLELISNQFDPKDMYVKNGWQKQHIEIQQQQNLDENGKQQFDFRVQKRRSRRNIAKQPGNVKRKIENEYVERQIDSDNEKIDAWRDGTELGTLQISLNRASDPLRNVEQSHVDQIGQFIRGEKILF